MLAIKNATPFAVALFPGLDKDGFDTATVAVKATFTMKARRAELAVADEQLPIAYADEHFGEPGASSVKRESDACPAKRGTDIVLTGHAYAPRRKAESVDVVLAAGPLRKSVRVFGERRWYRSISDYSISSPLSFERMPLVYERAFGGADTSDPDPANHVVERRNPVGTGFTTGKHPKHIEEMPLPNLEDPEFLIESPSDKPPPAGFGFVGRGWLPRASFAGTYDDAWRAERCPFLPADFDERYFHGAHPHLISVKPFRGGEEVRVLNASEAGEIELTVPDVALTVTARVKGAPADYVPRLDTLHIEPDDRRVVLTYRATLRCPRSFLYIDEILIRGVGL